MDGKSKRRKDPIYSTYDVRARAVKAVAAGESIASVARAVDVSYSTLYRWVRRYRQAGGVEGVRRKPGSGRPRKMTGIPPALVRKTILTPASTFDFPTDLWTVRRFHQVLNKMLLAAGEETVSFWTAWRRLHEAGLTPQAPVRSFIEADPKVRKRWMQKTLPKIKETVRRHKAILLFEDECTLSLNALVGRTWGLRGKPPKVVTTGARGSIYALSAIDPTGRLVFQVRDKVIASAEVMEFLGKLLAEFPRRHLVVVMDQASPHISQKTKAYIASQKRLHVFYLPPYSPDWNPDEKSWNHLKHRELVAHGARTKEELMDLANERLESMASRPELIRGLFRRCCIADFLQ